MSQGLHLTKKPSFLSDYKLIKPRTAFMVAMQKLIKGGEPNCDLVETKKLLSIAGFSQNGRNRILHLSSEEFSELCNSCPADEELWCSYVGELQTLLSKMDQARNKDLSLGRPYVSAVLANTICKLARLRYLDERGFACVQTSKLRDFLLYVDWCKTLSRLNGIGQSVKQQNSQSIEIQSAIQLMELYRDEIIMPPRLRTRQNYDELDSLHNLESGNHNWMEDGGESYLEAIRDIPLFTQYDELPHLESVLDWFVATKPVLDKNQIKRGWNWLEKSSEEWHQNAELWGLSERQINEYPSWNCALADRQDEWLSVIPPDSVYRVLPLTTPHQLLEESRMMRHCVVTYLEDCISGNVRIFSIRACYSVERIATVELFNRSGEWGVAQVKGKHNQDLVDRIYDSNELIAFALDKPLATILSVLLKWYNEVA